MFTLTDFNIFLKVEIIDKIILQVNDIADRYVLVHFIVVKYRYSLSNSKITPSLDYLYCFMPLQIQF